MGAPTQVGLESMMSPSTLVRCAKAGRRRCVGVLGPTPDEFCSLLRRPRRYSSRRFELVRPIAAPSRPDLRNPDSPVAVGGQAAWLLRSSKSNGMPAVGLRSSWACDRQAIGCVMITVRHPDPRLRRGGAGGRRRWRPCREAGEHAGGVPVDEGIDLQVFGLPSAESRVLRGQRAGPVIRDCRRRSRPAVPVCTLAVCFWFRPAELATRSAASLETHDFVNVARSAGRAGEAEAHTSAGSAPLLQDALAGDDGLIIAAVDSCTRGSTAPAS